MIIFEPPLPYENQGEKYIINDCKFLNYLNNILLHSELVMLKIKLINKIKCVKKTTIIPKLNL